MARAPNWFMTHTAGRPSAAKFLNDLKHADDLEHHCIAAQGLDPQLATLRAWQARRLAGTYADLLADPNCRPACELFLSDIYAARDFSQRNHDVERIHEFLARILPAETIRLLTETVELNRLTIALDNRLLRVLVDQLGVTDNITPEVYARAYRGCDNYAERVRQIDLTRSVLIEVGEGARRWVVGVAMRMAKLPAQRAGWGDLVDFLERGREAFGTVKDVRAFVNAIAQRERRILDLIYAADLEGFKRLSGLS
ncbi:MAG TPA: hypothetical protein VFP70_15220 [Burkholderiales bacterium]|nr:hypothetical protein [Burkholderiales bacterium]